MMLTGPDAASIAAARLVGDTLDCRIGRAFTVITEKMARGRGDRVVTLLCDGGDRYADTYFAADWVPARGFSLAESTEILDEFVSSGQWRG